MMVIGPLAMWLGKLQPVGHWGAKPWRNLGGSSVPGRPWPPHSSTEDLPTMFDLKALRFSCTRLPPPAPNCKVKYTTHWTMRCCLLLRMHQHNVRKLQVSDINVKAFCRMCPDETCNLHRIYLAHVKEVRCTSDLLGICHVKSPDLCSMVACLASGPGLDMADLDMFYVKGVAGC